MLHTTRPNYMENYKVYDTLTRQYVSGFYKSLTRAQNRTTKLDTENGSIRYQVKTFFDMSDLIMLD
jgi:hypothetical protein